MKSIRKNLYTPNKQTECQGISFFEEKEILDVNSLPPNFSLFKREVPLPLSGSVIGNTSDFGSEESRFEPWPDSYIHPIEAPMGLLR